MSFRAIEGQIDRAALRTTLTYSALPRLSVGLEYNPKADNFSPLANLIAVPESGYRPAVILGTSSDRIGTPSGQSFYGTSSKDLEPETGLPMAPYLGLAYGTYEKKRRGIAGVNLRFGTRWSGLVIYDGVHVHPMASFSRGRHGLSVLFVRFRHPGISYNVVF